MISDLPPMSGDSFVVGLSAQCARSCVRISISIERAVKDARADGTIVAFPHILHGM